MSADVVDNKEVKVYSKAGGEGTVVFDSVIALLQGLFPPTSKNRVKLADGSEVIAPLGGYQYVPGKLFWLEYVYSMLTVYTSRDCGTSERQAAGELDKMPCIRETRQGDREFRRVQGEGEEGEALFRCRERLRLWQGVESEEYRESLSSNYLPNAYDLSVEREAATTGLLPSILTFLDSSTTSLALN